MFPELEQPLSEEQIKELQNVQKIIPRLREQIRKAKTAGIDVSEQEQELSELEGRVQGLLRVYATTTRRSNSSWTYWRN